MSTEGSPPTGGPPGGGPPGGGPPGGGPPDGGGHRRRRRRGRGGRGPERAAGPLAPDTPLHASERSHAERPAATNQPAQQQARDERPRDPNRREERPRDGRDARPREGGGDVHGRDAGGDARGRERRPNDPRRGEQRGDQRPGQPRRGGQGAGDGRRNDPRPSDPQRNDQRPSEVRPRDERSRDQRGREQRPRDERPREPRTPEPRPSASTPSPAPVADAPGSALARPSVELDAGWGAVDDPPSPTVAAEVAVAERQPTPPAPRDPRDPDGEDIFSGDDAPLPPGAIANVAGVKFRDAGTIYEFDAGDATYLRGDRVVVESDRGPLVGIIAVTSRRLPVLDPLRRIVRRATAADEGARDKNAQKEKEAYLFCKQRIRERKLPMKLVRVEYPLASGKVLFYFASEERIDFRDLVKDLASRVHARIEMRQIGARDEAKMVGGIGSCGRELCCSTWLPAFVPVSIKMAKDQGLVLNPSKVSGQCGRLKCCLVYEHDLYKEMRKGLPKVGKRVSTPAGDGKVVELDVLAQKVRVWFDEGGSELFPPEVLTVLQPPPQPGRGGKLPVVRDDET